MVYHWIGVVHFLMFAKRQTIKQVEPGGGFAPHFADDGLLPAVVINDANGDRLRLSYRTDEALRLTFRSGEALYWSRGRQAICCTGEHIGSVQRVAATLVDDGQDALLLHTNLAGPNSCRVGYRSCSYLKLRQDADGAYQLRSIENAPAFYAEANDACLPNSTRL